MENRNFKDLSKEERMEFELKLGAVVMDGYKEAARLHKLNKKPCTLAHSQDEWECDWMKDGTEVHLMKINW